MVKISKDRNLTSKLLTPKYLSIYFLSGLILYGLVYFGFLNRTREEAKNFTNQASQKGNYQVSSLKVSDEVWKFDLAAIDNSGESGTALISKSGNKVKVVIELNGLIKLGDRQPAHIHFGSCPNAGEVKFSLSDVVDGYSETLIETSFKDLASVFPLAINVHQSQAEMKKYVACGDFK